jgi:hypothetical protein
LERANPSSAKAMAIMTTADSLKFDNPWKDIIERHFQDFTKFFFPRSAKRINWEIPAEFLDQELSKVIRAAINKGRRVDKLVKVHLLDGQKAILYIHLEIQSQRDAGFAKRVFITIVCMTVTDPTLPV